MTDFISTLSNLELVIGGFAVFLIIIQLFTLLAGVIHGKTVDIWTGLIGTCLAIIFLAMTR